MGILDNLNTGNRTGLVGRNASNADRPKAKYWLNVGYEMEGKFINLPTGIALDTTEPVKTNGQDEDWVQQQHARNDLLKQLLALGDDLEPGAEITLNLTVKMRRTKEEIKVEDNKYATSFAGLVVNS